MVQKVTYNVLFKSTVHKIHSPIKANKSKGRKESRIGTVKYYLLMVAFSPQAPSST